VVVCQGKTDILHSTESLVFRGSAKGIERRPVRMTTHDATTALIARTCEDDTPQVIFINHEGGRVRGDVPTYIYHGGPDGFSPTRRTELMSWAAPIAASCDFNDNGWADLFIGNCSENAIHLDPGSFLYRGGPEGFSEERKLVLPTVRSHGVAVGDFRKCGHLDLVSVGFCNAELTVFRGGEKGFDLENPQRIVMDPGQSDYAPERSLEWVNGNYGTREFNDPRGLLAADFNNNGWLDLWVSQISGPRCLILWGGPEGFSMERATWLATEGADRAQAADLTGNGYLDLVIAGYQCLKKRVFHESSITIYYGGPDGFREDRKCELPMHQCGGVAIADFNNNGVLDIFGACYNSGRERDLNSFIYWGERGGRYSVRRRKRLWTHSACGAIAADFNEDGWVDLAIVNHKTYGNHAGLSAVWWNGPEGFTEARRVYGGAADVSAHPGTAWDAVRGPGEHHGSRARGVLHFERVRASGGGAGDGDAMGGGDSGEDLGEGATPVRQDEGRPGERGVAGEKRGQGRVAGERPGKRAPATRGQVGSISACAWSGERGEQSEGSRRRDRVPSIVRPAAGVYSEGAFPAKRSLR